MDACRRLEKGDETRGVERLCFMASLLFLYKIFYAIHRARKNESEDTEKHEGDIKA